MGHVPARTRSEDMIPELSRGSPPSLPAPPQSVARTSTDDHVQPLLGVCVDDASYRVRLGQFLDEVVSKEGQNMLSQSVAEVMHRIEEGKLRRDALGVCRLFRMTAMINVLGGHFTNLATVFTCKDYEICFSAVHCRGGEGCGKEGYIALRTVYRRSSQVEGAKP